MTCEDLIEWAENNTPSKDFTDYRDLKELRDDLDDLPYGEGKRAKNAKERITEWFERDLDVDGYNSTIDKIEGKKIEYIKGLGPVEAKEEYDTIKEQGFYTEDTLNKIRGIVEGKEPKEIGDINDAIRKYTPAINEAKTQRELRQINLDKIEDDYGLDARDKIELLRREKLYKLEEEEKFVTLSQEVFKETSSEIESKTTKDELYRISERLLEIPNLTTDLRKELAKLIRVRMNAM